MFVWMLLAPAVAQETVAASAGHPDVPSASVAAEDGPGAMWVNAANQAYDPDPRFGLFFDRTLDAELSRGALGFGAFGQALGATVTSRSFFTDWTLDASTSVPLPGRLAFGATARWHINDSNPDFVAFDLGASWRPARWLGVSGSLQNIGQPDPTGQVRPVTRAGLAIQAADTVVVGTEYAVVYGGGVVDYQQLRGTLRLRATEGLYLRGHAAVDPDSGGVEGGGAVEFYFGGTGVGLAARTEQDDVGIGGWIGTSEPGEGLVHGRNAVPTLSLTSPLPDEIPLNPLARGGRTWLATLLDLQTIERETRYGGAVLTLSSGLGFARNAELHDRIAALEAAGKPVTVYLTGTADTGAYYAASAASQIVMHPAAVLDLRGVSLELQYFRGLMDQLGLESQVVRRAEFKSAGEMFTETEPSEAQREQLDALLDDVYATLIAGIARGRSLEEAEVEAWVDVGPRLSEQALEDGLVDAVKYPDELERTVIEARDRSPRFTNMDSVRTGTLPWGEARSVAVVFVSGPITSGPSSPGGLLSPRSAGSSTVVRQIDRARRDGRVGALVLRVDSPGGSAFASEEITRAVQRFERSGKPVVVSMGSLAASGGYYVSVYADRIFAQPSTITGSIGVISSKLSADALMGWLGIRVTSIDRGRFSGMDTTLKAWDEDEEARAQALVDGMYTRFKGHVEEGRDLEADAVEEVARGRVWSGEDASENGLVDELGGFLAALDHAREESGLPAGSPVRLYPPQADLLDVVGSPLPSLRAREGVVSPLEGLGPWGVVLAHPDERFWTIEPVVGGLK